MCLGAIALASGCGGGAADETTAAGDEKLVFDVDWSPDGRRIAFTGHAAGPGDEPIGLFVISVTGKGLTRLTPRWLEPGDPRWSPDGRRILFQTSFGDARSELYLVNADGSELTRLTRNRVSDTEAVWSPDGTRIAFARAAAEKPAYRAPGYRTGRYDLYVIRLAGRTVQRLTHTPADERVPTWSPDGRRIAFVRDEETISVLDLAHGVERRAAASPGGYVGELSWAPRGKLLAFPSWNGLVLVDATTRRTQRLARGKASPLSWLWWSPDGRRLTFTDVGEELSSPKTLWLVDTTNGRLRSLGDGWGELAWSPDGRRIAFAGGHELYLIDVKAGKRTILETPLEPAAGTIRAGSRS